ncbi:MAG: response regulator [Bacteroides sp.]|nr:response regulator [Bacteroides sp.]
MALSKYTILVTDCILTDLLLLKILLKQAHCHLLTATNGIHALQQARQVHPDLILLDIHMPEMNGFEVAAAMQSEEDTRHIPILYVVDMGDYPVFTPDGKVLSQEEYIEKPFNMRQLVKRILQRVVAKN